MIEECREVEKELRELRRSEETTAWQRCRPFIIRDGDKNTAFFHAKAANRIKRNKLSMLHDKDGVPHSSNEGMQKVVLSYYKELFASSRPPICIEQLDSIKNRLNDSMITSLVRPYVREENFQAFQEMHPCKSPGPDGLPTLFYKNYWNLVGDELCSMILKFLNGGSMSS